MRLLHGVSDDSLRFWAPEGFPGSPHHPRSCLLGLGALEEGWLASGVPPKEGGGQDQPSNSVLSFQRRIHGRKMDDTIGRDDDVLSQTDRCSDHQFSSMMDGLTDGQATATRRFKHNKI